MPLNLIGYFYIKMPCNCWSIQIKASCIKQKLNPSALPIGIPKKYNSLIYKILKGSLKDSILMNSLRILLSSAKIWLENLNSHPVLLTEFWFEEQMASVIEKNIKLAIQLLINTNKGFMYKTKTEPICFTNRNTEGIKFLNLQRIPL